MSVHVPGSRLLRAGVVVVLYGLIGLGLFAGSSEPSRAAVGSPILVVMNDGSSNPFGRYLAEILKAEGLNAFEVKELSGLTGGDLAGREVVILAETVLSAGQATLLRGHVSGGGKLVAMRPDAQIADVFGLGHKQGTVANPYIKVAIALSEGAGLPNETLQTHSQADRYGLWDGSVLAELYADATTRLNAPAVMKANYGQGVGVAWAYDLARSVVLTRQGNPANADVDMDGDGYLRTIDLFQAPAGGSWVNRDKIPIPQADEQQRLLGRVVRQLSSKPLPALWYFPGTTKTMLVLTGDAHANPTSYLQTQLDSIRAKGGNATLYLALGGEPSNASVQAFRSQGHEFGIHPYSWRPDTYPPFNVTNLAQGYNVAADWYGQAFTSLPSRTVRNHLPAWKGWTESAEYAANKNIEMDLSYLHIGPWLKKQDGTWPFGYMTGSGRPMRFMQGDGTLLPVYQQATHLVDEHMLGQITSGLTDWPGLPQFTGQQALTISKQLIDASQGGAYAAMVLMMHPDFYSGEVRQWAEGTMDYANATGVPLWNADRWLQFTQVRDGSEYTNIAWDGTNGTLTFNQVTAATGGVTLTTVLEVSYGGRILANVRVDGMPANYTIQPVKGVDTAFISVPAGNHSFAVNYAPGVAPTHTPKSTPTPTPTPINTPAVTLTQIAPASTPILTPTSSAAPSQTPTPPATSTVEVKRTPTPTGTAPGVYTSTRFLPLLAH